MRPYMILPHKPRPPEHKLKFFSLCSGGLIIKIQLHFIYSLRFLFLNQSHFFVKFCDLFRIKLLKIDSFSKLRLSYHIEYQYIYLFALFISLLNFATLPQAIPAGSLLFRWQQLQIHRSTALK